MSSQSAWMRTTNFGECCWYHSFLPSPRNGGCTSLRPQRPFTHLSHRSFGVVYSCVVINDPVWPQSSTAGLCSYLTWLEVNSLYFETYFQACCIRDNSQDPAINYMIVIWPCICMKVNFARRLLFINGLNYCIFPSTVRRFCPPSMLISTTRVSWWAPGIPGMGNKTRLVGSYDLPRH